MSERRLPVYLLLDTSGSMNGEPIESVKVGLQSMMSCLRQNPYAMDSVHLSIVTFDIEVNEILPLTPLEAVVLPDIRCPSSGATMIGAGLERIHAKIASEVRTSTADTKGDWRPLLFVMTDGKPSDTAAWQEMIPRIKALGCGAVIACAAGPKADPGTLKDLTDTVVALDTLDSAGFASFFTWVSAAVTQGSASVGSGASIELPPPPPDINVVL
ncbi:MAG: tellurium resistance protein [Fibrobacterota bacterium]|jgi:uncharacterized protein YegL